MTDKYVLDGKKAVPCDLETWAKWFEDNANKRHVADDRLGDVRVSTVFLGLDHNWSEHGPPLIFETMVFGGPLDGEMDRYSTWEEAQEGHAGMLYRVRAAIN